MPDTGAAKSPVNHLSDVRDARATPRKPRIVNPDGDSPE